VFCVYLNMISRGSTCLIVCKVYRKYNVTVRLFDSDQLFCDCVTAYLVGIHHATVVMYVPCVQALRALHIAMVRHVVQYTLI
jgi:hypothetical protein